MVLQERENLFLQKLEAEEKLATKKDIIKLEKDINKIELEIEKLRGENNKSIRKQTTWLSSIMLSCFVVMTGLILLYYFK